MKAEREREFENALPDKSKWHSQLDTDSPVVLIGDVHGCADELEELIGKCNIKLSELYGSTESKIIVVGDLVNKGPKSRESIRIAMRTGALCVRGNHDHASICAARKIKENNRVDDDKYAWVASLSDDELSYLEHLPFTISLPHYNAVVVHAGLVPGVDLVDQKWKDMIMMRDVFKFKEEEEWIGCQSAVPGSMPWAEKWKGSTNVFFGHDAVRGYQEYSHATGLDTGCVYGRELTAMILPARARVVVPAHTVHVAPRSKPRKTAWTRINKHVRLSMVNLLLPMMPYIARTLDEIRCR